VNAVAYKGCRVEIVGFRSNTAPKLIDVATALSIWVKSQKKVRKEFPHGLKYEDRDIHVSRQPPPPGRSSSRLRLSTLAPRLVRPLKARHFILKLGL
jgi:hypothetical protein